MSRGPTPFKVRYETCKWLEKYKEDIESEGLSLKAIKERIKTDTGIDVAERAIREWMKDVGVRYTYVKPNPSLFHRLLEERLLVAATLELVLANIPALAETDSHTKIKNLVNQLMDRIYKQQ